MNEYNPTNENEEQMKNPEDTIPKNESRTEAKDWQEPVKTMNPIIDSEETTLLKCEDIDELKSRWDSIQIEFVDEPRKSVEKADALLVDAVKMIDRELSEKRSELSEHFVNHDNVSTEDLRVTLQSYRTFLNRIFAL
jgi:hypothetical protein